MLRSLAAGPGWLGDYTRWRGAAGIPLALWHMGCRGLGSPRRRIKAPVGDGRTVRLRACRADFDAYRRIVVQREYELSPDRAEAIDRRCARALATGRRPLIVDAGGEIGLFAQAAARRWPQADLLCVEPSRDDLAMTRRNCTGLRNVRFREATLGPSVEARTPAQGAPGASRAPQRDFAADRPVEAATLDSLLAERPDAEMVLLKTTFESVRTDAQGLEAAFWTHRPTILVRRPDARPDSSASLDALLAQDDFRDADIELRDEGLFVFPTERPERELHGRAPLSMAAG